MLDRERRSLVSTWAGRGSAVAALGALAASGILSLRAELPRQATVPVDASTREAGSPPDAGDARRPDAGLPRARFEGWVVDEEGQPVAGALVSLDGVPPDDDGPGAGTADGGAGETEDPIGLLGVVSGPIPYPPIGEGMLSPAWRRATSDKAGRFDLEGIPPGRATLTITHADFVTATREIDVPAGETPPVPLHVVLRRAPPGRRVAGLVVDERGFPVANAEVVVEGGAYRGTASTGPRGEFAIERAAEGSLTLRVTHADYPPVSAEAGQGESRVVLEPGGGIEGDVLEAGTRFVVPGVRLTLATTKDKLVIAVGDDGRFQRFACPAGPVTLRAEAPGYVAVERVVTVPAARGLRAITVYDVRIELERER